MVWLTIELAILILVNPSRGQCPGWIIYARNGEATSVWVLVGFFTALPTLWINFFATRWKYYSEKIYESASNDPRRNHNYDANFLIISIGWSLFCTTPLWIMLTKCMLD
jgi:hypothetical protein